MLNAIHNWQSTRLIVLGDTIVDQYAACEAIGMSAEAPVVVVRELEHKNFIGGAAVVAAHISALGARCDFISVVGADDTAELVRQELAVQGIGDGLSTDPTRPTTFKKRYVVENQKLFESAGSKTNLAAEVEDQVIAQLQTLAPRRKGSSFLISSMEWSHLGSWRWCISSPNSTTCFSSGISSAAAR